VAQATLLCPSFDVAQKMLKFHAINLNVKTIHSITMNLAKGTMPMRGWVSISDTDCIGCGSFSASFIIRHAWEGCRMIKTIGNS